MALVAVVAAVSPAFAAPDANEVVRKAIESHGGADALNKYLACVVKSKGTIKTGDFESKFVATNRYQLPDRGKNVIELESEAGSFAFTQVIDGDKVESYLNGKKQTLTDEQAAETRQALYLQELFRLTPLLQPGSYTLKLLEKSPKVGDEATTGVSVAAKGRRDVTLLFSQKSGLLVGVEQKTADEKGKEITRVQTLSEHKKFDGVVRPAKMAITLNGKPFTNSTLDYTHFEKLPASELTK